MKSRTLGLLATFAAMMEQGVTERLPELKLGGVRYRSLKHRRGKKASQLSLKDERRLEKKEDKGRKVKRRISNKSRKANQAKARVA